MSTALNALIAARKVMIEAHNGGNSTWTGQEILRRGIDSIDIAIYKLEQRVPEAWVDPTDKSRRGIIRHSSKAAIEALSPEHAELVMDYSVPLYADK